MASEKKTVEFSFKVDQTSLNNLKNAIKSITEDMQKLIATAANINRLSGGGMAPAVGGGGNVSPQGAMSAIKTSTSQAQNSGLGAVFTGAGSAAVQGAAAVKRATQSMEADIRSVMRALAQPGPTNNVFNQARNMPPPLPSAGPGGWLGAFQAQGGVGPAPGPGGMPGAGYGPRAGPGGSILPGVPNGGPWGPNIPGPGMPWGGPPPPNPPIPPGGGPGGGGPGGGGGWNWAKIGLGVAAAANVVRQGSNEMMNQYRDQSFAASERGNMADQRIRALKNHDWRLSYAANNLSMDQKAIVMNETSRLAAASESASGVSQLVSKVAGVVPFGSTVVNAAGLGSGANAGRGNTYGMRTDVQQTAMTQESLARLQEISNTKFMENMAMEGFAGSLSSRVMAQRLGLTRGTGKHRGVHDQVRDMKGDNLGEDSYGAMEARLKDAGYSWEEKMSAFQSLRGGAGKEFARKGNWEAMAANAGGYGGYGGMMATAARAGGMGSRFARGALGGGIDHSAGILLGQTILGSGYDAKGTTSGQGLLAAFQQGGGLTGGTGDFNRVAALGGGMQLGDSIVGGTFSQYQAGRNLVSAIDTKQGGGFYAQDALANGMNMRQMADVLAGGAPTKSMLSHGITAGDVRKQWNASTGAAFDSFRDQKDGSSMSASINAMRASGMSPGQWLASLSGTAQETGLRDLGTFLGERKGGGGQEAGEALARVYMGVAKGGPLSEGLLKTGFGGAEKTSAQADAALRKTESDTLAEMSERLKDTIRNSKVDADNWKVIGENLNMKSRDFIRHLLDMSAAMEKFVDKWDRQDVGKNGPPKKVIPNTTSKMVVPAEAKPDKGSF